MTAATGYAVELGPVTYDAWRGGAPFTLAECWRECEGVRGAVIVHYGAHGRRVVLADAGECSGRRERVRRTFRHLPARLRGHQ